MKKLEHNKALRFQANLMKFQPDFRSVLFILIFTSVTSFCQTNPTNRATFRNNIQNNKINEIVELHKNLNLQLYSKILDGLQNKFADGKKFKILQNNLTAGNSDSLVGSVTVAVFFVDVDTSSNFLMSNWQKQLEDSIIISMGTAFQFWIKHASYYNKKLSFNLIPYYSDSIKAQFNQGNEYDWVNQVMQNIGYTENYPENVTAFNSWLRMNYNTDCSFSVFIFNYKNTPTDGALAYAALGGPRIIMRLRYSQNETEFEAIFTHEIGHIFWALDEYYFPGYGGATDTLNISKSPRSYISNGNADQTNTSNINTVDCLMKNQFSNEICSYTAAQVGWIDYVERTYFYSDPQGMLVDVSGSSGVRYQTPINFPFGRGTNITIGAFAKQVFDAKEYDFIGWNDGGLNYHQIITDGIHESYSVRFSESGQATEMWISIKPTTWWDRQINQIAIGQDNSVWVTNGDGIMKFKNFKETIYNSSNSIIPPNSGVRGVAIDKQNIKWFGIAGGAASYDDNTWKVYNTGNSGIGSNNISAITVDKNNNKWFASYDNGISMFDGNKWTVYNKSNSPILDNYIEAVAVDSNNNIWCGSWSGISEYDGKNWTTYDNVLIPILDGVHAITVLSDSIILAGTNNGIAKFENNQWSLIHGTSIGPIFALAADPSGNVYFGSSSFCKYTNGMVKSFNSSNSMFWSSGLSDIKIDKTGNKWIATQSGLWIYNETWPQAVVPVVIKADVSLPLKFSLSQNYPNPFNPATTINYSIPKTSFVTIKVYDIIGREIETLVKENKAPGNYEIKFNGNNLPSGIYFYRMRASTSSAEGFVETKKLIILK